MPKPVRADRRELRLRGVAGGNPTVDVFFDEHRVWSTKLPDPVGRTGVRRIAWPDGHFGDVSMLNFSAGGVLPGGLLPGGPRHAQRHQRR